MQEPASEPAEPLCIPGNSSLFRDRHQTTQLPEARDASRGGRDQGTSVALRPIRCSPSVRLSDSHLSVVTARRWKFIGSSAVESAPASRNAWSSAAGNSSLSSIAKEILASLYPSGIALIAPGRLQRWSRVTSVRKPMSFSLLSQKAPVGPVAATTNWTFLEVRQGSCVLSRMPCRLKRRLGVERPARPQVGVLPGPRGLDPSEQGNLHVGPSVSQVRHDRVEETGDTRQPLGAAACLVPDSHTFF